MTTVLVSKCSDTVLVSGFVPSNDTPYKVGLNAAAVPTVWTSGLRDHTTAEKQSNNLEGVIWGGIFPANGVVKVNTTDLG